MLDELAEATLDGTRKEHMEFLVTVTLLILDDLGMRKLPLTAVELHLKAGRSPFDVDSMYLKTGKPFRAAPKYRTNCA